MGMGGVERRSLTELWEEDPEMVRRAISTWAVETGRTTIEQDGGTPPTISNKPDGFNIRDRGLILGVTRVSVARMPPDQRAVYDQALTLTEALYPKPPEP